MNRAGQALGKPVDFYHEVGRRLAEHTLKYGLDREYGGVYRDGPHDGPALVQDKEWWQNCELMVGFLDAYEHFADDRYAEAFLAVWSFAKAKLIIRKFGERRQLLDRRETSSAATSAIPGKPSITPAGRCSSARSGSRGCAARSGRADAPDFGGPSRALQLGFDELDILKPPAKAS